MSQNICYFNNRKEPFKLEELVDDMLPNYEKHGYYVEKLVHSCHDVEIFVMRKNEKAKEESPYRIISLWSPSYETVCFAVDDDREFADCLHMLLRIAKGINELINQSDSNMEYEIQRLREHLETNI